ncbi:hypothetical protein N2152v2_001597 [Parachlorella kessleri]
MATRQNERWPTLKACLVLLIATSLSTAAHCQREATDGDPADDYAYDYWLEAPAPEPEYELGPAAEPAAEPAAAPLSDEQILNNCIALLNPAGSACTTESDTLALAYPRFSDKLPTPQQQAAALSGLKATGQPSKTCCRNLRPFADARCPCLKHWQERPLGLLPMGRAARLAAHVALVMLATLRGTWCQGNNQLADITHLVELRDSIENWPAFSAANKITGWNNATPVCVWGGVTCSEEGRVQTV